MIGIEAIFAIGGLAMIAAGLMGGLEFEKFKIPQLPNWVRATAIISGIVLVSLSIYIFPQSPFNPSSDLRAAQIAFNETQTAFYNSPTQTPSIQTAIVTQPPLVVTQALTQNTEQATSNSAVPIESLGVIVFDNSGREDGKGDSTSSLTAFTFQDTPSLFYELSYTTADDDSTVALVYQLRNKIDLSQYSALTFTIRFKDDKTRCKLSVFGSSSSKSITLGDGISYDSNIKVSISETSRGKEQTITIPIKPIFEQIGLSEVYVFEWFSNKTLTGESRKDKFILSDVRLIK
jgi:hypothetical protein